VDEGARDSRKKDVRETERNDERVEN